ncbi:MAG: tRNA epoxyqueuosine(34) reductase QueG [Candidatus Gracilibacteria bacterium]
MNLVIKAKIEQFAKKLGFDLIGFSDITVIPAQAGIYNGWLKKGYCADMDYLQKTSPRKDLKKILASANTVISLGINYYYEQKPLKQGHGRVARYAFGRDYHKIIGKKLKQLEEFIKTLDPNAETKSYVDTGPILERNFAEKSGLGTVGKNSCLITKEFGSWVFLSEIITNLKIKPSMSLPRLSCSRKLASNKKDFPLCGTCTRCIDSCPMQAIISPGTIDARKCISYLTIENKKQIPKKFHAILKKSKRLFGCDICQEVCPHNCRAKENNHPEFHEPPIATDQLNLKKILAIKSDAEFLKLYAGSPLMRAKRKGLQRNAKILL